MSKNSASSVLDKLKRDKPAPFRRQSGLIAAKISLTILEKVVRLSPVFGEQLGHAVGIVNDVVSLVEKHHLNRASNDELVNRMCDTLETIALAIDDPNISDAPQLAQDLDRVTVIIEAISEHLHQNYQKHTYERFILTMTNEDSEMNKNFCEQLDLASQKFSFSSGIQLRLGIHQVQQMLQKGFLDVQSLLWALVAKGAVHPEKALRVHHVGPLRQATVARYSFTNERGREPARPHCHVRQHHGHTSRLHRYNQAPALLSQTPYRRHAQQSFNSPSIPPPPLSPPSPPPLVHVATEPQKVEKTPPAVPTNPGTTLMETGGSGSAESAKADTSCSHESVDRDGTNPNVNTALNESTVSLASSKTSAASAGDVAKRINPSNTPAMTYQVGHKIKFSQPSIAQYLLGAFKLQLLSRARTFLPLSLLFSFISYLGLCRRRFSVGRRSGCWYIACSFRSADHPFNE